MIACRVGCTSEAVPADGCSADGFWHCASCHVSFPNNATATGHELARPDHRLAWWCFDHERLEQLTTPRTGQVRP